jgi:peroxiredoxin
MKRIPVVGLVAGALLLAEFAWAQTAKTVWSEQEQPIAARMHLRQLPDAERARATRELALAIRKLPASPNKLRLASMLASLATEGDFGRDTLQQVTTTLAGAVRETPPPDEDGAPAAAYFQLAQLVRYEHMHAEVSAPQWAAAMARFERDDHDRETANFTLADLAGRPWTLHELHGKVVLVNFWATWCPPCRKEMPDLDTLYRRFAGQGLVVLAVSDDDAAKVRAFVEKGKFHFPVLLDPDSKVSQAFHVNGIPKTFIYDRQGRLAAQSIDMRTEKQFLALLAQAGLEAK